MVSSVDRRQFLKIIGASAAATAAAGCGEGAHKLIPYVVPPETIVPGVPSWYATVCRECPAGCGMLAKNREGRVVKVEGNPAHPVNRGALCARGQAAVQGLYNPDRLRGPRRRDASGELKAIGWDEAQKILVDRVVELRKAGKGDRVAFVTPLLTGTLDRLIDDWLAAAGSRARLRYEPFGYESLRAANRITFGKEAIPHYAIGEAEFLLSFGADFLETWLSPVGYAVAFGEMHTYRRGKAGRFVQVEPRMSLTAAKADQWIPCAPGTEGHLALAMVHVILREGRAPTLPAGEADRLWALVKAFDPEAVAARTNVPAEAIRGLAKAFASAKPALAVGSGVALGGRNAVATQAAINLLNYVTGNVGQTAQFGPNASLGRVSPYRDVIRLTEAMAKGEVDLLLLYDVNPAFTLPQSARFPEAMARVPMVVSFGSVLDETSSRSHLVLPVHTPLESWGDFSPREGVQGLMQPAMPPVFDTRMLGDLLLATGREIVKQGGGGPAFEAATFPDHLRAAWMRIQQEVAPGSTFEAFWEAALRNGGVWPSVPVEPVRLVPEVFRLAFDGPVFDGEAPGALTLVAYPSLTHFDGRGANRPWLQEVPDPMTQIVWDAWVEIHPSVAAKLQVQGGDVLRLASPHGAIEVPALPTARIDPGTVAVPIGQGHTAYGRYASGRGANPLALLPAAPEAASGGLAWLSVKVTLTKTGRRLRLVSPQWTSEQEGRGIAEAISLADLRQGKVEPEKDDLPNMYPLHEYPLRRWGMAIDLDACIGCEACVVACQAENNVPMVGKDLVGMGRSMHWIRIERYLEGDPAHPDVRFLPMLCQQCGNAPCESVCPVFAAYHTREGLNAQIYNRCVGTRYCANNCPYKVRRFNWFTYKWPEPLDWQLNPDVTVREMGVMEKCTFCVQRILAGEDRAKDEGRPVRDGEIVPACQQTCPTQAIVFGDLKDPGSEVSQLAQKPWGYHVFHELNTRSAVTYLKKVTRSGERV